MSRLSFAEYAEQNFDVRDKGSGDWWGAVCPWHDDSSPSLRINIVTGKFRCMTASCGVKGLLGSPRLGLEMPSESLEVNCSAYVARAIERHKEKHARYLPEGRLRQFMLDQRYWIKNRGLSHATCQKFKLGTNPDMNTAVMPLWDIHGGLLGIIQRQLGGTSTINTRYHDPKGVKKSKVLYCAQAIERDHHVITVCEGPVDALALWDVGIPAVAILGSQMSKEQLRLMKMLAPREVCIFADNDDAGDKMIEGTDHMPGMTDLLDEARIPWSVAQYREGWAKDPAALSPNQRIRAFEQRLTQLDLALL